MKKELIMKILLYEIKITLCLMIMFIIVSPIAIIDSMDVKQTISVCISRAEAAESSSEQLDNQLDLSSDADAVSSVNQSAETDGNTGTKNAQTFQYSDEDQEKIDEYRNTLPVYSLILTGAAAIILIAVLLGDKIKKRKKKRFKF